jgi:hypothetical protein
MRAIEKFVIELAIKGIRWDKVKDALKKQPMDPIIDAIEKAANDNAGTIAEIVIDLRKIIEKAKLIAQNVKSNEKEYTEIMDKAEASTDGGFDSMLPSFDSIIKLFK